MNDVYMYILSYAVLINLAGFALMGIDKRRAKRRKMRIPEAVLFTVAIFGGGGGVWPGMYIFKHKIRHWYFVYGMPAIMALQAIGISLLLYYYAPTVF